METWTFLLFFLWLWKFQLGKVKLSPVFYKSKAIIIILILWLIYIAFQCIPLPISLIEFLSPEAAYLHSLSSIEVTTATLSVAPHLTVISLLKSISYFVIFLLTVLLVRRDKRLTWLAYTLVFSGLFQAFYGSIMLLSGMDSLIFEKKYYMDVATGTFVNRNHLAGYLEMTLAVGIGLLISQLQDSTDVTWKQRLRSLFKWILSGKMLLRLYLVIMVIALVLTHSRMGNTGFFASMMIAGVIALIFKKHATRSTIILLVSLLIIDMFIVGAWFGIEKVAERIQGTSRDTIARDEVDEYTLNYWKNYLWTGSGLGTYYLTFPKYREHDISAFFDHAHNDYFEFGVETGIIGLLLVGSCFLLSLWVALLAQYKRRNPLNRGISFSVVMALTAILIHSTVDFNLQIPANAATFMVIMAMGWIAYYLPHQEKRKRRRSA